MESNNNRDVRSKMYDVQGTVRTLQTIRRSKLISLFVFCLLMVVFHPFSFAQKTNKAVKDGNEAYRKNDYKTAIQNYEKALQYDAKNTAARFNMANAQQRNNEDEKSASEYDDLIDNTTDADLKAKAYYNKALALIHENKLDEAIGALKESLRLMPNDSEARDNLQKAMETKKQQQPQPPPEQDKKQPPPKPKQQKQQQMSRQMMEQKFKELEQQEKQLQKDLQKQKTNTPDNEKDW